MWHIILGIFVIILGLIVLYFQIKIIMDKLEKNEKLNTNWPYALGSGIAIIMFGGFLIAGKLFAS